TERSLICEDTGALIQEPPKLIQPYRNENVKFLPEEIAEIKRISPGRLCLLGFKPLSCLKDYYNLRPSTFVYPSDQDEITSAGAQMEPPGMHMIYLPFSSHVITDKIGDISQIFPDTEEDAPRADEDQIQKVAALIKRIYVKDFSAFQFANPVDCQVVDVILLLYFVDSVTMLYNIVAALQRHYAVLQALALAEDDIPETIDETAPDEEGLTRPAVVKAAEAFKLSVYGDSYDEESDMGKEKMSEASRKRKAIAENAAKDFDWGNLADKGQLKNLTVGDLKVYLNAHNLPVSGKKEALISRILTHMGK
ncbi:hypothetical protein Gotri_021962, partial [Gossypium trilobum]|nr:hypothetical protein [Gossypium trilobum]